MQPSNMVSSISEIVTVFHEHFFHTIFKRQLTMINSEYYRIKDK